MQDQKTAYSPPKLPAVDSVSGGYLFAYLDVVVVDGNVAVPGASA